VGHSLAASVGGPSRMGLLLVDAPESPLCIFFSGAPVA